MHDADGAGIPLFPSQSIIGCITKEHGLCEVKYSLGILVCWSVASEGLAMRDHII